jgi:hypothetical protein
VPIAALVTAARAMICQQAAARQGNTDAVWPPAHWSLIGSLAEPQPAPAVPQPEASREERPRTRSRRQRRTQPPTAAANDNVVSLKKRERRLSNRAEANAPSGQLGLFG